MGDYAANSYALTRTLSRREPQQPGKRYFLRGSFDPDKAQSWHIEQHTDKLTFTVEQTAADAFDQYVAVDPRGKILLFGRGDTNLELPTAGSYVHGQRRLIPGSPINRNRLHSPTHPHPLAVVLAVSQFAERIKMSLGRIAFAEYVRILLPDYGSKAPWSGYPFDLNSLAQNVAE